MNNEQLNDLLELLHSQNVYEFEGFNIKCKLMIKSKPVEPVSGNSEKNNKVEDELLYWSVQD